MTDERYQRDVGEQLAEALPMLGQAALKRATEGIQSLLTACPHPTHQKLMIWLWTLGYARFGPVSLTSKGPGFRLWFPDDGADFAVAFEDVEVAVRVDPVKTGRGELTITSKQIEAQPRSAANGILDHLAKLVVKVQQKADRQKGLQRKQVSKKRSAFIMRPADGPRLQVDENNPLVRAIGESLSRNWDNECK